MKKVILSTFVILTFILYSITKKESTAASMQAIIPPTKPSDTPIPTTSDNTSQILPLTETPSPTSPPTNSSGIKDGSYRGDGANAYWGTIQVQATISGGKLTDVQFLSYPNDRGHSIEINQYALPILKQEAIQNQSAQVDIVSGATDTSRAFMESLSSALSQAK